MLIAAVVNNSGKRGCGVLWRNKYYGKCAAQPRRMRKGKREQEAQKGRLKKNEMANRRKGNDVKVKNEKTARDNRYDEGEEERRCGKTGKRNGNKEEVEME